jgi:hypothetical protein
MSTNYTPEELAKIAGAVTISGMAVAIVEAGIISTAIEATAMGKEIAGAATKYPNNSIIQSLFSAEDLKQVKDDPSARVEIKPEELQPDTAVGTAIAKINDALRILAAKATPDEVREYKEFIYACCDRVANAAGSGLFGSGTPKVSPQEADALAKIKAVLA